MTARIQGMDFSLKPLPQAWRLQVHALAVRMSEERPPTIEHSRLLISLFAAVTETPIEMLFKMTSKEQLLALRLMMDAAGFQPESDGRFYVFAGAGTA